jgi:hypothetical protein
MESEREHNSLLQIGTPDGYTEEVSHSRNP